MQHFYSTRRKSVTRASDSPLKLISYSPVFLSIFFFVDSSCTCGTIKILRLSITSATTIELLDKKIGEYEISLSDEPEASFHAPSFEAEFYEIDFPLANPETHNIGT